MGNPGFLHYKKFVLFSEPIPLSLSESINGGTPNLLTTFLTTMLAIEWPPNY